MYETFDILFASYLLFLSYELNEVKRKGRRVSWVFIMSDRDIKKAEASWPCSPSFRYSTYLSALKEHLKK
tara:strand:+ start:394 stop:603 length:210 start_codon:yes stop_codon:yes gene_type:complete